ncbi:IclR family transcriptional regulator [Bradyrhizobium lablabi]|uniref:IclR family transcriptional regulator n=1 Tax=Bradyrhizobium lablabi TaxID=722472 RepID=UPI001BA790E4|nr:IclR family transcriptional regulator [Bradyrhizobium lablabi]MBR1119997.1 IclR family transcriptional regulator [Bradyrhizobium lablabi]
MASDDTKDEGGASTVRAVDRAIAILQCFTADKPALSVLDIQKRVGLSRPTLYRLLQTLGASGLIKAEGDPQRFRLAHGVMELAHVWLAGLDKVDVARPILEQLRESTGETAALFVLREQKRICVLELESHHALTIARGIGDTGDITLGASGKAILAFLDEKRRDAILDQVIKPRRAELMKALEVVRSRGYAVSHGEVFVGAVALAAPTFNHNGEVAGCLGVFGPKARVKDADIPRIGAQVMQAASTISEQYGYRSEKSVGGKQPKPRPDRKARGVA